MRLKMLDLFSGIGGFSLAARWTEAIDTVGFCEIDLYCQAVLCKNFPGVPIHDDIRTFHPSGSIDIVTGGFPCQPFSVAGKQRGQEDDRHLWPDMARVIDEVRPRWIVGENTPGIINLALDDCLLDLESLGYEAWPVALPACGVNAPHRRDRVWIVAHADGERRQQVAGGAHGNEASDEGRASELDHQLERDGEGGRAGTLADTDLTGSQRRDQPRECPGEWNAWKGSQPFQDIWRVEPPVGRVAHGISSRVDRLRALGNAIVPQVAYVILQAIVDQERKLAKDAS